MIVCNLRKSRLPQKPFVLIKVNHEAGATSKTKKKIWRNRIWRSASTWYSSNSDVCHVSAPSTSEASYFVRSSLKLSEFSLATCLFVVELTTTYVQEGLSADFLIYLSALTGLLELKLLNALTSSNSEYNSRSPQMRLGLLACGFELTSKNWCLTIYSENDLLGPSEISVS